MELNRFDIANAKHLVQGYYFPSPSKPGSNAEEFERAKRECITNLKQQLEKVESLTVEQFNCKTN